MTIIRELSWKSVLLIGFLVGTLDLLAAFVDYSWNAHASPFVILNYIASAVFGKEAISGGTAMKLAGLSFHYLISLSFTFLFFALYTNTRVRNVNRWFTAVLYAILMWLIVNEIVIPLSRNPGLQIPFSSVQRIIKAVLILTITIGVPLSFFGNSLTKGYIRPNHEL